MRQENKKKNNYFSNTFHVLSVHLEVKVIIIISSDMETILCSIL